MRFLHKLYHLTTLGIILLFAFAGLAQNETITLSGQLLDKETAEPIPYASIYLKEKPIGTTTNEDGYFVFHISPELKTGTVVLSVIGYTAVFKKINAFKKDETIFLSSQITKLDEVSITATRKKQLTAKEIVRKAYKEIPNNYPITPYVLEGYVRGLQKEDNQYVEYLECAAKFFYQGYKTAREPQVELLGVRNSYLAPRHPWNEESQRKNALIDLVEDDFIRFDYGPIAPKRGWKFELDGIIPYQGGLLFKIEGIDSPFQTATVFIDTETFAFVKIELTRKAINNRSWRRRFTNGALQVYYNVVFEYQKYKGKMYLKYQKEEDHWKIFEGLESGQLLLTQYPKKELFINNIITENVDTYPFERNMDIGSSIENQAANYDIAFWKNYNIPQQTQKESAIIKELKKITE